MLMKFEQLVESAFRFNRLDDLPADTGKKSESGLVQDWLAAIVVSSVTIPMCLGIATLSGVTPSAGLIAGIIGGVVVGLLSGSQTSITGPSAGLTFVVALLVTSIGSFEGFLLAVLLAGFIQLGFATMRLGGLVGYVPSSVLQGLLAAIGLILVLKQIPHLLGHDTDPEGDMSFLQPDRYNTLSELSTLFQGEIHRGSAVVGLASLALLMSLQLFRSTKSKWVPNFLVTIVFGTALAKILGMLGGAWVIEGKHLLQLPEFGPAGWTSLFTFPDWSQILKPQVYSAAIIIALASTFESLLNISATDRLDRQGRYSPPSRELFALGCGNVLAGLLGGIPMSSAVERSAVSLQAGSHSKVTAVVHGFLLLIAILALPNWVSTIPLAVMAAILIATGLNLLKLERFRQIWKDGGSNWFPLLMTFLMILFTNLLIGVFVGLCVAVALILLSNLQRPLRRISERHVAGEVFHIELANQVSFLNRPALERSFREIPDGCDVLFDATETDYIDPDILTTIRQYKRRSDAGQGPRVSLKGFRDHYELGDEIQFVDYTSRETQSKLTPSLALQLLQEGNQRFLSNRRLTRDLGRQVIATSEGQHPFAAVLSCIDSRAPVETILDCGLGDVFSARVAGNVTSPKVLGSLEFATAIVGAKLILVLGHTKCGAVYSAVKLADGGQSIAEATGCQHLHTVLDEINACFDLEEYRKIKKSGDEDASCCFMENVAKKNVLHSVKQIVDESETIQKLVREGRVAVVGALYDVKTGNVDFFDQEAVGLNGSAKV